MIGSVNKNLDYVHLIRAKQCGKFPRSDSIASGREESRDKKRKKSKKRKKKRKKRYERDAMYVLTTGGKCKKGQEQRISTWVTPSTLLLRLFVMREALARR